MKILVDACVSIAAKAALADSGHEVDHVSQWDDSPSDEQLLNHASRNEQIIVTLDKDFGELAVVRGITHHGIVRIVQARAAQQGALAAVAIARYVNELQRGAIVTVEPTRVRVRLPE